MPPSAIGGGPLVSSEGFLGGGLGIWGSGEGQWRGFGSFRSEPVLLEYLGLELSVV